MAGDRLGTSAQRMPNFSDSKNNQRAYYVDMHDVEDSADYDEGRLKNSSAFFFPSDVETNSKTNPISKIYHDDDDLDDDDDDDNGIDDDPIKSKETSDESLKSQVSVLQKKVIFQKYTHLDKKILKKENDILFAKLKSVKNKVVSRHIDDSKNKAQRMQKFRIPQHTLVKYQQFIKTPRPRILRKLIRPKIFLDLEGKNVRPMGRICIQLFTEACPEVVLEFVRMGMDRNAQRMDITRIYPGLCIESELHFTQKVLNEPLFEYDMTVMDHGFSYGILSFAKCYLAGFKTGVLNFSISFKPLSVLNGERIVFGIVTRGLKVIDMLEDYGTSNGRLLQDVRVTKCGMLK